MTHDQIIDLYARLAQLIEKTEDGLCRYKEGDDASVAREFGVTVANVAGLRVRKFGPLRLARTPRDHTQDRIEVLERTVDNLSRRLDQLVTALGGLPRTHLTSGPAAHTNGARSAAHE